MKGVIAATLLGASLVSAQHGYNHKPHRPHKPKHVYTKTTTVYQCPAETGTPGEGGEGGEGPDVPLVDSQALQDSVTAEGLAAYAQELEDLAYATPLRNRVISSQGFNDTVDWIIEKLESFGGGDYYTVTRQPFIAPFANSNATIQYDGGEPVTISSFQYAPSGVGEGAIIPVANLGCEAGDFPPEVEGNVALISRGECEFGQKVALAGGAGAVAAILYNNAEGDFQAGTLGAPPRPEGEYVPAVALTQANGTAILDRIEAGEEVLTNIALLAENYNVTVWNVIADSKFGDLNSTIALGGHSDSVYAGPGINDDGSGTVGLLQVAENLANYRTNNNVRFIFWGAEEFGLLGSYHYTEQLSQAERDAIRLYLNFDMIASPNYYLGILDGDGSAFNSSGPPGSAEAEAFFESWFADQGLPTVPSAFTGRSDYGPFLDVGIAAGGLFTGADEVKTEEWAELYGGVVGEALDQCYHQECDDFENLNFEAWVPMTKAIAAAVAEYGTTFDSLPAQNVTTGVKRKRSADLWKRVQKTGAGGTCNHAEHNLAK